MLEPLRLVVSCEHAGNAVPGPFQHLFGSAAAREALAGHRGWDLGALPVARMLARRFEAPLFAQLVTRLVVDCNRSAGNPSLWSEFTKALPPREKEGVLRRWWEPHRASVQNAVAVAADLGPVIHVGVHTFTPVWNGRPRATSIGLLYDPRRERERRVAVAWRRALAAEPAAAGLRVHLNLPYRGWTDGLVTTLRNVWPEDRYLGFELEVSQRLVPTPGALSIALASSLAAAAKTSLAEAASR